MLQKKRDGGQTREKVLQYIDHADDTDLSEFVQAFVARYHRLFPDYEIIFLSMPKNDPAQREWILRHALHMLDRSDAPDK